jgi:tetratricopeptide (TPR) repeat protein
MISLILALVFGVLCAFGYAQFEHAGFGIYVTGILTTLGTFILINKKMTTPISAIIGQIQKIREDANEQIQRKARQFQSQPGGNQVAFMKMAEKLQEKSTEDCLVLLQDLEKYYKWNFLLEKQVNTMKYQFYFQMKKFEEADKYLDKVLLLDPMGIAMKMARVYKKEPLDRAKLTDEKSIKAALKSWSVTKIFNKGASRLKGSNTSLVYSTYAWMLLKSGLVAEALAVLTEGFKKSADPIIEANIDRLRNNKDKSFSNAKYGEQWYALFLEEPPKQKPKMVRQSGQNQGRPF